MKYIDVHLATGQKRVVAVTPEGGYVASCVFGKGYSRRKAGAFVREVVSTCGAEPSKNPPEWFERVQRPKVENVELTLAESIQVYALPAGSLVETTDGLGRIVASGLAPSGAGKVTISPRTKGAWRYR